MKIMDTTAEMKKTKMLYGILRPMSTQWEWFDEKLNLSIMQDYVSESQWEIDTTEDATTDHGYQTINHSKWIKKHDRALVECVSLTTGVDLYVNEEGALHGGLHPSVHVKDQRDANIDGEGWNRDQTLRGTVIAVRHDEMGDTVGLYPSDKKSLELSGTYLIDFESGNMVPILQLDTYIARVGRVPARGFRSMDA